MLPQLRRIRKSETYINIFRGLNRTVNTGFSRVSSNSTSIYTEFKDMKNLCGDDYPQLRPRKPRSRIITDKKVISNLLAVNGSLVFIDSEGNLNYEGQTLAVENIDTSKEHNLVMFGNNVVILPDKKYFNLGKKQFVDIDFSADITDFKNLRGPAKDVNNGLIMKCSIRKTVLGSRYTKETAVIGTKSDYDTDTFYSENGIDNVNIEKFLGTLRLREDGYTRPSILYNNAKYNAETQKTSGTVINDNYVRLCADEIGTGLNIGDYIKISGMTDSLYDLPIGFSKSDIDDTSYLENLNNHYFRIYDVGENYIVIKANLEVSVPYFGTMTISKLMPESDYDKCIEVNNRLWTCSSDNNEIYACKQGDCTNWQAYSDGIATDSYAMTVGCEGDFTGIARQNDSVIYFKENWVLKIYGTKPSNYTLATYNVLGVQKGSSKSVVWINGVLYYLSTKGVCRYSPGGQPEVISEEAFGNVKYSDGVAGRHNNKYYISAQNDSGEYELFVFDTETGLWHKEDNTQMLSAVTYNNTMYYIDGNTGYIMCPDDSHNLISDSSEFEREGEFDWSCETSDLYDSDFSAKYISRISIGVKCEKNTEIKVYAQFEENGGFRELRTIRYDRKKPQMIPVAVRRSDYLRLRLEGKGQCNIYGISIEYAQGSRVR